MSGIKGMRWKSKKRSPSPTVKEALAKNEDRLPDLLDDLYDLALDTKATRKERIEALKFLVEKAAPRTAYGETTGRAVVWTAEDLQLHCQMIDAVFNEQRKLLEQLGTENELTQATYSYIDRPFNLLQRRNEILPIKEVRGNLDSGSVEADFQLPDGTVERKSL